MSNLQESQLNYSCRSVRWLRYEENQNSQRHHDLDGDLADRQLFGVVLRFSNACSECLIPGLRFNRGQLGVAILQNVVSRERIIHLP